MFLTDDDWAATLTAAHRALRSGGWLVFETRVPAASRWAQWTPELTHTAIDVPGIGTVESWEHVVDVAADFVTFQSMTAFSRDDVVIESVSTLRFRDRPEIEASLVANGFELAEIRDAPDRPGLEFVFLSRRSPHLGGNLS